jgi:hypothetical protein
VCVRRPGPVPRASRHHRHRLARSSCPVHRTTTGGPPGGDPPASGPTDYCDRIDGLVPAFMPIGMAVAPFWSVIVQSVLPFVWTATT